MTTNQSETVRHSCMICSNPEMIEIMNLGLHSFADRFIPKDKAASFDPVYPLICNLCMKCGQIQLRAITSPDERYCTIDYSYTSSNSNFARQHWIDYAKEVSQKINLKPGSFVVEAGSNDGFLTEQFAQAGAKVLGVDPSPYIAKLATERNVETIVDFFNSKVGEKINNEYGKANLIVANNVFNHSENPVDFARAARDLLTEDGFFVFELPYWAIGMQSGKFDQVYHEHVSYLTARSSASIMEQAGLRIAFADVVNYHGGSLRVYAQKKEVLSDHSAQAKELMAQEERQGLFSPETYSQFMKQLIKRRSKFLVRLHELRAQEKPIIAVGAAAKGNTFLNFYKLDNTLIDFVTDSSPHKQGKYTPLTRIPIVGDEVFAQYKGKEVYALILSWNIADQLKKILDPINPNITFISPEENS